VESERWQKVDRLYHSALAVEQSQRASFLEQACAGDQSLKQEVESLLAESEGGDSFLEAPAMQVAAKAMALVGQAGFTNRTFAVGGMSLW
jgi:hypothetical protein